MQPEPLVARSFSPEFAADIPRHWLPGNQFVSCFLNAYTVLVPANESFYIRTFKQCMPLIDDADLRAVAVDFVRQEAQHGIAHKRYWANLEAQGYRFRGFERTVEQLTFRVIERTMPLSLRIALVSCVEHINACLAHDFLLQRILVDADPRMRALMEWHFAEEIEHKAVSFDVLLAVAPGYAVRALGLAVTAPLFYLVTTLGTLNLLAQDGLLFKGRTWLQIWRYLGPGNHMASRTLRNLLRYLRPGFHPGQFDDTTLAGDVINRQTRAAPPSIVRREPRSSRAAESVARP